MKRKPKGDCYRQAFEMLQTKLSVGTDLWLLVHGYPTGTGGEAANRVFGHAWIETADGEWVIDPGAGDEPIPAILYYSVGQIRWDQCVRYPLKFARQHILESEHYGPWAPIPKGTWHREGRKVVQA